MSFEITILGSSSALPTSVRYPTSHFVDFNKNAFLIDCGEGTQIQLRKYRLKFNKINHIFISHLHGDHCFGLLGLISSFMLLGRKVDLHIYANSDLEKIITCQLFYFGDNLSFNLIFHALDFNKKQLIYENKTLEVYSFPLKHRVPTCGFLFQEKTKEYNIKKEFVDAFQISIKDILKIKQGEDYTTEDGKIIPNKNLSIKPPKTKSYAFCSDTKYYQKIIPYIKGVNLLYHEATFTNDLKDRAKQTFHSTAEQAAKIALEANVEKLIIGHFSTRYKKLDIFLKEAKEIFSNTYLAKEGEIFKI